jgi:hypothetical protein
MVVRMMKQPKWIFQLCWKCFYNGFHMSQDTKLWAPSWVHDNVTTLKGRANKIAVLLQIQHTSIHYIIVTWERLHPSS